MGESSKLDRAVQHLTKQRTATPKTKGMFDCFSNTFDHHQITQSSIEQHLEQLTNGQTNTAIHRARILYVARSSAGLV